MQQTRKFSRRVVLVQWKTDDAVTTQVFSSLSNFCLHYPSYSYNTLSNYLSKQKKPYENSELRIERMPVISGGPVKRKLVPVVRKANVKKLNEGLEDVTYWLSRPVKERLAAVTFLVNGSSPERRMDKTLVYKGKRK